MDEVKSIKMAGDSTTDSTSPNKRLKTSSDDDDSDPEICGICLSNGGAIRGEINSCDHFFCFVCIMEWAKVESRCPICKRRFTSIHRPPKEGVFASQRLVHVPQRDQVYHLYGNATSGPFDPYAQVRCSVCHGISDESLLLLCDLCDSAAHTYCVGLGATVPDGDWFCHDCALSRSQHDQSQVDTETHEDIISANYDVKLPSQTDVSVFNIVRESNIPVFKGHNAIVSSCSIYSSHAGPQGSGVDEASNPSRNTVGNSTDSAARTLRLCRNVHSRIQVLRENWQALQNRSLSFSSGMPESGGGSHGKGKGKVVAVSNHGLSELQSSTSTSPQATSQHTSIQPKEDFYDIDKAWKMMNIAKSMQKNCKTNTTLNRNSTKLPCLGSDSKEAISSSGLQISKNQQNENRNEERTGKQKQYGYYFHEKEKNKSPEMEKQKKVVISIKTGERVQPSHSPRFLQSSSSAKVQIENGCCRVKDAGPSVKNTQSRCRESSSISNTGGRSCSTSLVGSVLGGSTDSSDSNLEAGVSKLDIPKGRTRLEKSCSKRKDIKDDTVKSEIQALVKLNLKLLSKDKQLGVDAFKEIARLATHTILAACGYQHSESAMHSFPSPVCSHSEDIKLRQKSTLMPNSCRECFYAFVKNVVCSIVAEKGQARSL